MKYYTSTTEFNCGIDLHAHQMYVCLMDRSGKILVHTNIKNNDFKFFLKLIEPYRHDLTVCAECMFGWYWLADACHEANLTFVLAHALYSEGHSRRQEQERPHRLGEDHPSAAFQSHPARLRLSRGLASLARALAPAHLLRLATLRSAGPAPVPSTGSQPPHAHRPQPLQPRSLGKTAHDP